MSLSTYFNGEIKNVSFSEFVECLTALTGHCYFLQNEAGDLFRTSRLFFNEGEEPQEKWGILVLPYGEYRLTRVPPVDSFHVKIEKDKSEDQDYADGLRIQISSFVDKPYQESDFVLLKELCRHLGYSSYQITSEYGGEPILASFDKMSSAYFRNIRGCVVNQVARVVDRLAVDYPEDGNKRKPNVGEVYRKLAEKKNEENAENGIEPIDETAFLYDMAVVNGYYECGLFLKEYKKELKSAMPNDFERARIDRIFEEFEAVSSELENCDRSPEM